MPDPSDADALAVTVPFARVTAKAVALLQIINPAEVDAAPSAVIVDDVTANLLASTEPVPLPLRLKVIFESVPEAVIVGLLPVAAFAYVIAFTADAVVVKVINAAPFESFIAVLILGDVSVLFVKVSVVARPIKVSVEVGNVNVPLLTIVLIIGLVNVLFVKV